MKRHDREHLLAPRFPPGAVACAPLFWVPPWCSTRPVSWASCCDVMAWFAIKCSGSQASDLRLRIGFPSDLLRSRGTRRPGRVVRARASTGFVNEGKRSSENRNRRNFSDVEVWSFCCTLLFLLFTLSTFGGWTCPAFDKGFLVLSLLNNGYGLCCI